VEHSGNYVSHERTSKVVLINQISRPYALSGIGGSWRVISTGSGRVMAHIFRPVSNCIAFDRSARNKKKTFAVLTCCIKSLAIAKKADRTAYDEMYSCRTGSPILTRPGRGGSG